MSRRDIARNMLALVIILAVLGGGVWLVWALSRYGDPVPEPGLPIDNRTGEELLIYSVVRDDSRITDELLRAEIRQMLGLPEPAEELAAALRARDWLQRLADDLDRHLGN